MKVYEKKIILKSLILGVARFVSTWAAHYLFFYWRYHSFLHRNQSSLKRDLQYTIEHFSSRIKFKLDSIITAVWTHLSLNCNYNMPTHTSSCLFPSLSKNMKSWKKMESGNTSGLNPYRLCLPSIVISTNGKISPWTITSFDGKSLLLLRCESFLCS